MAGIDDERARVLRTGCDVSRILREPEVRPPTPRNLNLYLYIDRSIAATLGEAEALVFAMLREAALLERIDSPLRRPSEGSDAEATLHTLAPYQGPPVPPFTGDRHPHELHLRLFYGFPQEGHAFWAVGASVHLEPDNSHDDHRNDIPPYFGSCPLCGCAETPCPDRQEYHRFCRDGLGLELLFHGTVHGQPLASAEGPLPGIWVWAATVAPCRVAVFESTPEDLGVDVRIGRLGSVVLYR